MSPFIQYFQGEEVCACEYDNCNKEKPNTLEAEGENYNVGRFFGDLRSLAEATVG